MVALEAWSSSVRNRKDKWGSCERGSSTHGWPRNCKTEGGPLRIYSSRTGHSAHSGVLSLLGWLPFLGWFDLPVLAGTANTPLYSLLGNIESPLACSPDCSDIPGAWSHPATSTPTVVPELISGFRLIFENPENYSPLFFPNSRSSCSPVPRPIASPFKLSAGECCYSGPAAYLSF